ncbi:hypothetical protein NDU88_005483 [Pleurodeles waltl]|uniref:Tf2-1-like SH3-like domain-containing protein n=1 Tax=Pleurodeles waltl TaxID=8319 RepID=A0AAV7NVF4_PLEWA|nr:hypothetical protein NDU88_005483 [Pleurodeles waltl]
MLAEQWEETDSEEKELLTYTRELRDTFHTVWEEAHSTLREAQEKQKKHYDTKSVFHSLKIGDKALILLPTCDNKLLARWQGPYEVIGQVNPTTYRLALPCGLGREQMYHINLLKKWQEPVEVHPVQFITNVVTDAIPSAAVERKTADLEKQEGEDDGESRADSSGSSSGAEVTVLSAVYTAEEEPKKPVVPSRDEGDDLREAGRECQPRFRRSVADAGAWSFRG